MGALQSVSPLLTAAEARSPVMFKRTGCVDGRLRHVLRQRDLESTTRAAGAWCRLQTRTADRWSPLRGGACEGTLTVRGLGLRFAVKAKNDALARTFLRKGLQCGFRLEVDHGRC